MNAKHPKAATSKALEKTDKLEFILEPGNFVSDTHQLTDSPKKFSFNSKVSICAELYRYAIIAIVVTHSSCLCSLVDAVVNE